MTNRQWLLSSLLKRRIQNDKISRFRIKRRGIKGITDQGFEEAFPIQEAVIPVLLSGRDVVGQAHTGSGKTAAFALSMLQEIQPKKEFKD